ncbi:MAG: CDP-alcohol phosphatidyltransferase family protein [Solirubrobacterales bacterium]
MDAGGRSPRGRRVGPRRLLGIDRSGPNPRETGSDQPWRPLTLPNLIGFLRLAGIPVYLVLAFESGDGRTATAAALYLAITASDYLDGFLARATGQYSRLGALLDPLVDRLTVLAGVVVCWHFELLPRWALAALVLRELVTLLLAQLALRRGVELQITWIGRISVFLVFGGLFWAQVVDWLAIDIMFIAGVVLAYAATALYVRSGIRRAESATA